MNIQSYTVIFFFTGLMLFMGLRKFAPWSEQNNKLFYLIIFSGLISGMLLGVPKTINEGIIMPFFAGMLVGEFFRGKVNKILKYLQDKTKSPEPPMANPDNKNVSKTKTQKKQD